MFNVTDPVNPEPPLIISKLLTDPVIIACATAPYPLVLIIETSGDSA